MVEKQIIAMCLRRIRESYDESKHKRGTDGKFTSQGGGEEPSKPSLAQRAGGFVRGTAKHHGRSKLAGLAAVGVLGAGALGAHKFKKSGGVGRLKRGIERWGDRNIKRRSVTTQAAAGRWENAMKRRHRQGRSLLPNVGRAKMGSKQSMRAIAKRVKWFAKRGASRLGNR